MLNGIQAGSRACLRALVIAGVRIAVCLAACVLACLALPAQAHADYENPSMSTTARVQTDNSLLVTTQRLYVFDERYTLLTIPLSQASSNSTLAVESVRLIQVGESGEAVSSGRVLEEVRFQAGWRELFEETRGVTADVDEAVLAVQSSSSSESSADAFFTLPEGDAFAFDERNDRIYVFMEPTELSTIVEFDYVIEQACSVYEDVAELYWDYASPWFDADTGEVEAQIQLPVPEGVSIVLSETVRAWGHGPEGEFDIGVDGVVDYQVTGVKSGQYAQAHVIFPVSWLSNITLEEKLNKGGLRADGAISGEVGWTDTYTAWLVNEYLLDAAQVALCLLLLGFAVAVYMLRGREVGAVASAAAGSGGCPDASAGRAAGAGAGDVAAGVGDAQVADAGMPAVRAEASPVVVSRLLRGNQWNGADFVTELEALAEKGVITIEDLGDDARFRVTPKAKSYELSRLDRSAMSLVFDVVGDGYQSVSVSDVRHACKGIPGQVGRAMRQWHKLLDVQVASAGVFDARSKRAAERLAVLACVVELAAVLELALAGDSFGWLLVLTGAVMLIIAANVPRRTPLGCALTLAAASEDAEGREERDERDGFDVRDDCSVEGMSAGVQSAESGSPSWRDVLAKALDDAMIDGSGESE